MNFHRTYEPTQRFQSRLFEGAPHPFQTCHSTSTPLLSSALRNRSGSRSLCHSIFFIDFIHPWSLFHRLGIHDIGLNPHYICLFVKEDNEGVLLVPREITGQDRKEENEWAEGIRDVSKTRTALALGLCSMALYNRVQREERLSMPLYHNDETCRCLRYLTSARAKVGSLRGDCKVGVTRLIRFPDFEPHFLMLSRS